MLYIKSCHVFKVSAPSQSAVSPHAQVCIHVNILLSFHYSSAADLQPSLLSESTQVEDADEVLTAFFTASAGSLRRAAARHQEPGSMHVKKTWNNQ